MRVRSSEWVRVARLAAILWLVADCAQAAARWKRWELAGGTHAFAFVPDSVRDDAFPPVVVFFHGFGSSAFAWQSLLGPAAETAKVVVLVPKSRAVTWALGSDDGVVEELLPRLAATRAFDRSRVSLAGHSAGGAYAAWLAHARPSRVAAVMSASASFLAIPSLADFGNRAPVRLLYGTLDPNYVSALPQWRAQWGSLGIATTEELVEGAGHSSGLTGEMFTRGFIALSQQRYVGASPSCAPDTNSACLGGGRLAARVVSLAGGVRTPLPWTSYTTAHAAVFGSDEGSGAVVVRVTDGCAINGRWWIFAASAGPSAFEVEIVDTLAAPTSTVWKRTRAAASTRALVDRLALPCGP